LVTIGEFTKGQLFIPRLNLWLWYKSSTIILLRYYILPHEVKEFFGGKEYLSLLYL
ncbi:hypothetical protein EV424DRAFT_1314681, partial [Suillus variegatus]